MRWAEQRHRVLGSGVLAIALISSVARAQSVSTDGPLSVVRAAGAEICPAAPELHRRINAQLGRDPWDFGAQATVVTIAPRLEGLTAWVTLTDDSGQPLSVRQVDSSRGCDDLAASLILILSIALDRQAREVYGVRPALGMPPPDAARPELTRPEARGFRPPMWWGGAGGLLVVNGAPAPMLGGLILAEARWERLALDLEGRVAASGQVSTPELGGSFRLLRLESALAPCYRRGYLLGCVVVGAGAVLASGSGYTGPLDGATPILDVGIRGVLEPQLVRSFLTRVSVDLTLSGVQTVVTLNDNTLLWRQPLLGASVSLSFLGRP